MAQRKSNKGSGQALKEFVTVAFAEDHDLAKQYKEMLEENNIPAMVKTQPDTADTFPGIAVLVPEDFLDEAHVLIESESGYNDFYDMAFEDRQIEELEDLDVLDDTDDHF